MSQTDAMPDPNDPGFRFVIFLLIKHPHLDPDIITRTLGLTPRVARQAGKPRRNPKGLPLKGVYEESTWGHTIRYDGSREFDAALGQMIDRLEPHTAFLHQIVAEGAEVLIIFQVPGDVNNGGHIWDLGYLGTYSPDRRRNG